MKGLLLAALIIIVLVICGCTGVSRISAQDISSVTVTGLETGGMLTCSEKQVIAFTEAYNSTVLYTNDVGTTHPYRADVVFSDETTLTVWGGTQGFCTIKSESAGQQNIKSQRLDDWFEGLG